MLCRWLQEAVRDNCVVMLLFIDPHANTRSMCTMCSLDHYHAGLTHYSSSEPHIQRPDCKDNVRAHSEAHPCLSVSQEILTLLLHQWRLHPLITISCISRWSQARLTSLTRPLSPAMLIGMGRTPSMDVCVKVYIGERLFLQLSRVWLSSHPDLKCPMLACVFVCVLSSWSWHIGCANPFNTQRSGSDTAWKDLLTETESLSVSYDETHFRTLEKQAIIIRQHHCPSLLQFVDPV